MPKMKREDDEEIEEKTGCSDEKEEGSKSDGPKSVKKLSFDYDVEGCTPDDGMKADCHGCFNYFNQIEKIEGFDILDSLMHTGCLNEKEEGSISYGPKSVEKLPFSTLFDGVKEDRQVWTNYFNQIEESEGFDIVDFPGTCEWTHIVPITEENESLALHEDLVKHAKLAITKYNTDHEEAYEFINIEKANATPVAGLIYYITFRAKNHKAGDEPPLELFQAKVWAGITESEVMFCRPKPKKAES